MADVLEEIRGALSPFAASVKLIIGDAPNLVVPPLFMFAVVFHHDQLIVAVIHKRHNVVLISVKRAE